jgi:elongation factor G
MPRLVFVNKMDRESASFERALSDLERIFGKEAVPLSIPIGEGTGFMVYLTS